MLNLTKKEWTINDVAYDLLIDFLKNKPEEHRKFVLHTLALRIQGHTIDE